MWKAQVQAIYISAGHDYWTTSGQPKLTHGIESLDQVVCVAGRGLLGDRYFNGKANHKGQVTFMDGAVIDEIGIQFNLPHLDACIFRRNLIVRGVKLSDWLGRRFEFQGIQFEGIQECRPCKWMDRMVAEGAQDFMKQNFRGGLRARILTDGILSLSKQ